LSFNAAGLFAHDPTTGRVLWSYPWLTPPERNNVCQPIVLSSHDGQPDRVFISSGYGKGCALLAVGLEGERFQVRQLWANKLLKSKFASAVVREELVFGLDDGILTCIDLQTGTACWKQGRYGHGQLLLAGDLLIVQAEKGDVVLVAASAERHQELGRFAALADRTWNHPALAGNLLLVRNDREAACYRLPAP
jgi:outer membrane protein assembly factor BamB